MALLGARSVAATTACSLAGLTLRGRPLCALVHSTAMPPRAIHSLLLEARILASALLAEAGPMEQVEDGAEASKTKSRLIN